MLKLFEKLRRRSAAARLLDEPLYEQVLSELENGQKRNGLWAKALANSDGLIEKANALYIQYRFQSIKDEMEIASAIAEEAEKLSKTEAVSEHDRKRLRSLGEIKLSQQFDEIPKKNNFTIWQAVTSGNLNLVLSIIESGGNINILDAAKQTAVDIAKSLGKDEIERVLRQYGGKSAHELK